MKSGTEIILSIKRNAQAPLCALWKELNLCIRWKQMFAKPFRVFNKFLLSCPNGSLPALFKFGTLWQQKKAPHSKAQNCSWKGKILSFFLSSNSLNSKIFLCTCKEDRRNSSPEVEALDVMWHQVIDRWAALSTCQELLYPICEIHFPTLTLGYRQQSNNHIWDGCSTNVNMSHIYFILQKFPVTLGSLFVKRELWGMTLASSASQSFAV